jgi:hypothetical protein
MASSTVVEPSPAPSAAAKSGRFLRRTLLLLLAGALVIGLGTVVTPIDDGPPPLSTTEQLRVDAEDSLLDAAGSLEALAGAEGENNDGGSRLAARLAGDLRRQAALFPLVTTWPSGSPAAQDGPAEARPSAGSMPPAGGEPSAAASGAATSEPEPSPQQALNALSATYRLLLDGSQAAEPGLARLLASVGAAVYSQATALHGAFPQTEPPARWTPPPAASTTECPPAASGAPSSSPATMPQPEDSTSPGTPGGNEAQAVAGVVVTEYRTIFTYEAALPRLSGKERAAAEERYAAHRALAGRWEDLAASACLGLPERAAAYPFPADPAAQPLDALAAAERDAASALADAVAFNRSLSGAAAADLAAAAVRLAETGGRPPLTPGLDEDGREG